MNKELNNLSPADQTAPFVASLSFLFQNALLYYCLWMDSYIRLFHLFLKCTDFFFIHISTVKNLIKLIVFFSFFFFFSFSKTINWTLPLIFLNIKIYWPLLPWLKVALLFYKACNTQKNFFNENCFNNGCVISI